MKHILRSPLILASMLFLCLLAFGCGQPKPTLVPVTGKVTKAGQPVTAGSIYLHAASADAYQKDTPSSMLQLDGSFSIKTFPFGDGVPPGDYKVTLSPELASRLKLPQHGTVTETPLTITVPPEGLSNWLIDLK
jgi:hypothetical protein